MCVTAGDTKIVSDDRIRVSLPTYYKSAAGPVAAARLDKGDRGHLCKLEYVHDGRRTFHFHAHPLIDPLADPVNYQKLSAFGGALIIVFDSRANLYVLDTYGRLSFVAHRHL